MITGAETAALVGRPAPIYLEGRLPILEAPLVRALGLHDGQVVRPTVEVRGDQLRLLLQGPGGSQLLELPPALRGAAGQALQWRIQLLPSGQAVLRPLPAAGAEAGAAAAAAVPQLPERLAQLAFRPPGMDAWLQLLRPDVLAGLWQAHSQAEADPWMQRLLRQRPGMAQLTPEAVRQALQRTGMGSEALLARGMADPADLKATLRQLLRTWTQAPAAALNLLGQALDDIEASQLRAAQSAAPAGPGSAEAAAGRELVLAFVLPFADADPVAVELRRPRRQSGQEAPPFFVQLHTRSRELGEVWLHTRILESQVDLTMWAVRQDVAERARAGAAQLSSALDDAGLQMTGLRVIHGARPGEDGPPPPSVAGRLVDLKA